MQEIIIDYTDCATTSSIIGKLDDIPSSKVTTAFKSKTAFNRPRWAYYPNESSDNEGGICSIEFTFPNELPAPVFFYYRLTNFYQNHRRYVKSVEERQLKGEAVSLSSLESSDACSPLIKDPVSGKPYYPCGLIANSLFNDTFTKPLLTNVKGHGAKNETYEMTTNGIAWASDKARYKKTKYKPDDVMPPPNWQKKYPKYTDENPPPDLSQREDLQVWMRTAGLPTFSKLAMKNTKDTMIDGTYLVNVTDSMWLLLLICELSFCFVFGTFLLIPEINRLQRQTLWRHEIHRYHNHDRNWRQEPVPGDRIRDCRWTVCPPRHNLCCKTLDQAEEAG